MAYKRRIMAEVVTAGLWRAGRREEEEQWHLWLFTPRQNVNYKALPVIGLQCRMLLYSLTATVQCYGVRNVGLASKGLAWMRKPCLNENAKSKTLLEAHKPIELRILDQDLLFLPFLWKVTFYNKVVVNQLFVKNWLCYVFMLFF